MNVGDKADLPAAALDIGHVAFRGRGLQRPECALAHLSGTAFAPCWHGDGGVSIILPDGETHHHLAANWKDVAARTGFKEPLRPNGIALMPDASFLLAHLGAERGGVFRLYPDGSVEDFLLEVDGQPLPPANFVIRDAMDRVWITVSTRKVPRAEAYRFDVADGFIVLADNSGARIVADGLGYTNEAILHPDGKRLFVNETFARRLTAFDIWKDGSLLGRTTIAEFGAGTFPDGLAFDAEGNAWITSIVSNRILRVLPDGSTSVWLEDCDPGHLTDVEKAFLSHTMGRPHLDQARSRKLQNISNLAFSGPDLKTGLLGCLLGDALAEIPMPVAGHAPLHWTTDIGPLIKAIKKRGNREP